jgi:putative chitinase
MLTETILRQMWPNGDSAVPGLVAAIAANAPTVFTHYNFNDDLAIAQAMAQFTVECGGGHEMVESLNYTADALLKQWPGHFTPAQAQAMAHDEHAIANQAYNGRMENGIGTDDGWNFRGRGLSQTTGRSGYRTLGPLVQLNLLSNPDLVNNPQQALVCGVVDFVSLCGCLPFAQNDDVIEVSQRLNGGFIGFAERTQWLVKWKQALGVTPAKSGTMLWVQQSLNTLGASPQLVPDSEYGQGTKAALVAFQAVHGLKQNGLPTRDTIAAIKAAMPAV